MCQSLFSVRQVSVPSRSERVLCFQLLGGRRQVGPSGQVVAGGGGKLYIESSSSVTRPSRRIWQNKLLRYRGWVGSGSAAGDRLVRAACCWTRKSDPSPLVILHPRPLVGPLISTHRALSCHLYGLLIHCTRGTQSFDILRLR